MAESAGDIFRSLQEISFSRVGLLALAGVGIAEVFERVVLAVATRLPARFRFYLLPWPPLFRLFAFGATAALITPLVLRPDAGSAMAFLGSMAFALGFAVKGYVESVLAGVLLLFERPFTVGDWVRVAEHEGEITSIDLRTFSLRTPTDDTVTIPHSTLWSAPTVNSTSGHAALQVTTDFYLHPDHDSREVRDKLQDLALTSPFIALARPVVVGVGEQVGRTHYQVKAYPRDARDLFMFRTDLTMRGRKALSALGVAFAHLPGPGAGPGDRG